MKKLFTVLFVALSLYSCSESLNDESVQDCGDVRNVAHQSFDYCGELKDKPTQPVYVLISSAEEMSNKFTTCQTFDGVFPDFTQKRILGLSSGPKPTTGYTMNIQSVRENDCQIAVEYFEKPPKDGEAVTSIVTYPIDFVVLPKSNKPILFVKVTEVVDYAIIGSYSVDSSSNPCDGDCQEIFKIENQKVLQYLNVENFPTQFNKSNYKALVYKEDLAAFLLKVPTAIKDLKGQTKTFGTPDSDNQGGTYFEWSQAGVVTKIYLDNNDTTDQNAALIAFKNEIQDKIAALKSKS